MHMQTENQPSSCFCFPAVFNQRLLLIIERRSSLLQILRSPREKERSSQVLFSLPPRFLPKVCENPGHCPFCMEWREDFLFVNSTKCTCMKCAFEKKTFAVEITSFSLSCFRVFLSLSSDMWDIPLHFYVCVHDPALLIWRKSLLESPSYFLGGRERSCSLPQEVSP